MEEGTIRQRRNLFITGIAIVIAIRGDITIGNISVGEMSVQIGNKTVVYELMWVLFIYFLVRYCQYFLEKEYGGARIAFLAAVNAHCTPAIRAQMKDLQYLDHTSTFARIEVLHWKSPLKAVVSARHLTLDGGVPVDVTSEIATGHLIFPVIRGVLRWLIKTPHFTDLFLPVIFAAAVLGYAICAEWPGSLAHVVAGR